MAYFDKYGVEFSDDRKTLVRCPEDFQGEYVIPDGVTHIGENNVYLDEYNRKVIPIPRGGTAFMGCAGLTSIIIPNSVLHIYHNAFEACKGLTSVVIPNSVFTIEEEAFRNCRNLKSITIGDHVTHIEERAFENCTFLSSITIPDSVKEIGIRAFADCQSLMSASISVNIDKIEDYAFANCARLEFLTIPEGIKEIGEGTFFGCRNLKSIVFPKSITHIGKAAFRRCLCLTSISIPDSVTSIGDSAFDDCESLRSISLGNGAKEIGEGTFAGCNQLASISIGKGVSKIGYSAFWGCKGLNSVVIPDNVSCIEDYAFERCENLKSILIGNGVTHIGRNAFSSCYCLTLLLLGSNIEVIGEEAFFDCKNLDSIKIPKSVISIGWNAFNWCNEDYYTLGKDYNTYLDRIYVPTGHKERLMAMDGLSDMREDLFIEYNEEEDATISPRVSKFYEFMFFDTETTGVPRDYKAPVTNSRNWPRLVQLAWIMTDKNGKVLKKKSVIIKPDGFSIPSDAVAVHGITTEQATREGRPLAEVLDEFATDLSFAKQIVGHNIDFDQHIVGAELCRMDMDYDALMSMPSICTMKSSTDFCAIPSNSYYGGYKWPSLSELYHKLFGRSFEDAHDALADITATMECFFELKERGII